MFLQCSFCGVCRSLYACGGAFLAFLLQIDKSSHSKQRTTDYNSTQSLNQQCTPTSPDQRRILLHCTLLSKLRLWLQKYRSLVCLRIVMKGHYFHQNPAHARFGARAKLLVHDSEFVHVVCSDHFTLNLHLHFCKVGPGPTVGGSTSG
jgi:hypothetical protein